MRKVFCYAVCLLLFAATGCNDNTKSEGAGADSTKAAAKQDPGLEQMKAFFAAPIPGFNPDSTIQNLSKYPDLFSKTKTVKFSYNNFNLFIDSLDRKFNVSAKEVHFLYAAYTPAAVNWYLRGHSTLSHGDSLAILNKPCLVIAYKDPTGQFIYALDMGTICPPPNSCETVANYPLIFNKTGQVGFDPGPTIANYDVQYEDGKNPIHPLTQRVKFDIASIRYLVDSMTRAGTPTTDIYLAMGAYTNADAQRYVSTHPAKPPISASDIQDRTCLLFAFKKNNPKAVSQFIYYDFGTICPPPNSCETAFVYTR